MPKIIIKVERVSPGDRWQMETPDGKREVLRAESWTRVQSSEALDLFENVYHYPRQAIRFDIR